MTTRQKRGDGSRKKVTGTAIMPRRCDTFFWGSQNKASLIQLISKCINPISNSFQTAYSSDGTEPATLLPSNHEKGDCRVLLHCENMSKEGVNQAMIFTVDTDVVVIATSVFSELSLIELLIEFGKKLQTGNIYQFTKLWNHLVLKELVV